MGQPNGHGSEAKQGNDETWVERKFWQLIWWCLLESDIAD